MPFVDTESNRMSRRRPTTDIELQVAAKAVVDSAGWFRNSGIAYEMNSYYADGALFDWVAGVMDVPVCICAEMWGGPVLHDCFEMFNPSNENLAADIRRMRVLFESSFASLLELHTGTEQPTFESFTRETLDRLDAACLVESDLLDLKEDMQEFDRKVKRELDAKKP